MKKEDKKMTIALTGLVALWGAAAGFGIASVTSSAPTQQQSHTQLTQQFNARSYGVVVINIDPGVLTRVSKNMNNLTTTFHDNATDGNKLVVSVQCQNDSGTNTPNLGCHVTGVKQVLAFG